jgi:DNA-binding transcriptional ArsR family regulator
LIRLIFDPVGLHWPEHPPKRLTFRDQFHISGYMDMTSFADTFKALGDGTRLRIMVMLTRGELCVCDLTRILESPQSTVSRHMSRLKLSGLVADRRNGKWVYYRLAQSSDPARTSLLDTLRALCDQEPHAADIRRLEERRLSPNCSQ